MTSEIRTNSITSRAGLSTVTMTDSGPMFSGITTFVDNSTFSVGTGGTIHAPATNTLNIGVNNTESLRIDSNSNLKVAGIVTATHFYGNGGNLTSLPSQVTISNNADNRVITGGSGVNLNGESNLTFDGSTLGVTGDFTLTNSNHVTQVLKAGGSTSDLAIDFKDSSNNLEAKIFCASDQGDLRFYTGGANERLRITSGGDVVINDTTADGNVHPDTKLHVKGGITFRELTSASESALPAITQWSSSGSGQDLAIGARSNNAAVIFFTGNSGTDGDWGDSSNAERLRIDSSGNMNLGSGATVAGLRYLDVQNSSTAASNHGAILRLISSNAAGNGTASVDMVKYKDGNFYVNNNETSGSTNFNTGGSTRLTITSNGNLQLNNYSGNAGQGRISFGNSGPAFIEGYDSGNAGSGAYLRFQVNTNEKVRIPRDTWGLLVTNLASTGNTGGYQTEGVSLRYNGDSTFVRNGNPAVTFTRQTDVGKVIDFYSGTTYAGGIYVNGSNNTALQQGSDYRLKTDITSMTDGINKVKQLNPIYYKANSGFDTTTVQNGFLAHEVQSVLPTLVDGEKDAPIDEKGKGYQTLNYAGFTPTYNISSPSFGASG